MRSLILTLALLTPISALALSCPNNGSILKAGDSIQEVTKLCGQAISSNSYTSSMIISAEWKYYITNPSNNTNTKLKILFDHGLVANINVLMSGANEQNVTSTNICKMPVQVGSNMNYVRSNCGNPVSQKTLQTASVQMTELKYDGSGPNTLIFENGELKSWK
jgi:hypothetical protein